MVKQNVPSISVSCDSCGVLITAPHRDPRRIRYCPNCGGKRIAVTEYVPKSSKGGDK